MTEPVAYIYNYANGDYALWHKTEQHIEKAIPLYTKEQIQPKVQMTQAEFDEFKLLYNLFNGSTVRGIINTVENNESKRFTNLKSRLNKTGKDLEIIILWSIYNPDEPDETIEIVTDMKWFVISKKRDHEGDYAFLAGIINTNDWIYSEQHDDVIGMLYPFDTKGEAEKWTNPLTKAVQLPAEGE